MTSDRFLELPSLPPAVTFVGGGYISFEFAHIAARAGARATILHRGSRPLARFDPDLVDRLVARTSGLGVDVRLGTEVQAIESLGNLCRVTSFLENHSRRILGAHLLGPHADETINLFALAMRPGFTADQFKEMLWAYPTQASDMAYMV